MYTDEQTYYFILNYFYIKKVAVHFTASYLQLDASKLL